MTSRERIMKFFNHEPVDRIPCGIGSSETGGMHLLSYDRLKKIYGYENISTRLDTCMVNAVFEREIVEAIQGDIILVASPSLNPTKNFWTKDAQQEWGGFKLFGNEYLKSKKEDNFIQLDNGDVKWGDKVCPNGGYYFDPPVSYYNDVMNFDYSNINPDNYNPPMHLDDKMLYEIQRNAEYLYNNTDFALSLGETLTDLQVMPCSQEMWWMLLASEPELVSEFLEKAYNAGMSQLKELDQAVGKYVNILCIAHDFGDSRGVTMGPNIWREVYKPYYKKYFTTWHQITNMKANFHSCGSIIDILPEMIECGIDMVNPVQISARGMDPESLLNVVQDKIFLFGGGYDSVLYTVDADYNTVYNDVKEKIKALSKYRTYIFSGVHNLPAEMPESHIRAMFDAYNDIKHY